MSVREERDRARSNYFSLCQGSLTYGQMQKNVELGRNIRPETNESIIAMSQSSCNLQSNGIKRFTRINDLGTKCRCSTNCRWIAKWMKELKDRGARKSQRLIVEQDSLIQIDKDIPRTEVSRFRPDTSTFLQQLRDILIKFAALRPQIGYVQGMNMIAASILTHTR